MLFSGENPMKKKIYVLLALTSVHLRSFSKNKNSADLDNFWCNLINLISLT